MNVVELPRALRQLRCSGIAAGLEARVLEAQAEKLAPVDSSRASSRTSCFAGRIVCSNGA